MTKFIFAITLMVFSFFQAIAQDYNYQGYLRNSTGVENVRASFYVAGDQFDPMTVFNSSNYPIWFKENDTIEVENGILNYRLVGIDVDSLIQHRGQLYLYVMINGSPFDKVLISDVPYSTHSAFSANANHSLSSDTSAYSINSLDALHSVIADTASYSLVSTFSDSSRASNIADTSLTSLRSFISDSALTVEDGSITSDKIAPFSINTNHFNTVNSAANQTTLSFVDGNFVWASREYINTTTVEQTLVVPTSINDNTLYFISQVAQDYSIIEPTPRYGRLIRIVNASTANTIQVSWPMLFGGSVFISPRSSVEFMYINMQWIKL